jgi:hypothetical protein
MPTRIQIVRYYRLVAEAVVETPAEANKLWSRYAALKYQRGLDIGGAIMTDDNHPKEFDVRVGSYVTH